MIAALALFALASSDLPLRFELALGIGVVGSSLWELARMRRQPAWRLHVFADGEGQAEWIVDGLTLPVRLVAIHPRGPIIGIRFDPEDHPPVHALWWPDTLGPETRRSLMLLARGPITHQRSPSTLDSN